MNKPGYKTTEFWLTFVAMLVGSLMASGLLDVTATAVDNQLAGMVAMMLSGLGYTAARGFAKSSETKAAALVEASKANPTQP